MKRWPSQLFPILLLGLLAALSFWLEHMVELPEARHDGKQRHDPDVIIEQFKVQKLDPEGHLQYRLAAPHMQHFPDDDTALLTQPRLAQFRAGAPETPVMTLSSDFGQSSAKGETVRFWGNVLARRAPATDRPAMEARTSELTVRPDDGVAFTDRPVEIVQGNSWMKGVGAHLDNNTSVFVLQSQVTGLYYRNKAPQ